jgi:hypothetical protein
MWQKLQINAVGSACGVFLGSRGQATLGAIGGPRRIIPALKIRRRLAVSDFTALAGGMFHGEIQSF